MRKLKKTAGFTLLEIIIVIIILGVLASLALPRMFHTVQNSHTSEAISAFRALRQGMESCYLMNNQNYVLCGNPFLNFRNLGVNDPAAEPGSHFASYTINDVNTNRYSIIATHQDNPLDYLIMTFDRSLNPPITIMGSGAFSQINISSDT